MTATDRTPEIAQTANAILNPPMEASWNLFWACPSWTVGTQNHKRRVSAANRKTRCKSDVLNSR